MLKSIVINGVQYACNHWRSFPPFAALTTKIRNMGLDACRKTGAFESNQYETAKVWERICHKFKMDSYCLDCEHVRKLETHNMLPCLVTLDGKLKVPQIDPLDQLKNPHVITVHRTKK